VKRDNVRTGLQNLSRTKLVPLYYLLGVVHLPFPVRGGNRKDPLPPALADGSSSVCHVLCRIPRRPGCFCGPCRTLRPPAVTPPRSWRNSQDLPTGLGARETPRAAQPFGLTLRPVLTCASVGHSDRHSLEGMARHKDEDHIVFTSNLLERHTVGACPLSSGALSDSTFPAVALRNIPGPHSFIPLCRFPSDSALPREISAG